jgi:hypothetical protein
MATKVHRPLKIVAFNANGIGRQRYELSKQMQDLKIDVAVFGDTQNLTKSFLFQIITFIGLIASRVQKAVL